MSEELELELELDEFFSDIFIELEEREYESHPPKHVLRDYLKGKLKDKDRLSEPSVQGLESFMKGEFDDWATSEVSLHVATCAECSAKVAEMRAQELAEESSFWERIRERSQEKIVAWDVSRRSVIYVPLAYTAACLLFFALVSLFPSTAPVAHAGGGSSLPKRMM